MKKIQLIPILAILAILFSCKTTQKTATEQKEHLVSSSKVHSKKEHKVHWSYNGDTSPKYWSQISEEYKDCAGDIQSPINIDKAKIIYLKAPNYFHIKYNTSKTDIVNNGHTVQFNITAGNQITFNNTIYQLKQFHLHALSEHTINGEHLPLEIHFVNKATDDTYAVIAVFFEEGKASTFFTKFLDKLPTKIGGLSKEGTLNLQEILPETKQFYHYKGSFTTPPCTEIVEWIILKNKKTASKEQLEKLHQLLQDNFRPVQEINHRKIEGQ